MPALSQQADLNLVVIGGPYKSGTSALCEAIEALGYANPARLTNGHEHGHGSAVGLYLTRECSAARELNRRLVRSGPKQAAAIERRVGGYLNDMVKALGCRLVLKDPYMKLTALSWMRAANELGATRLTLALTEREPHAVQTAWARSRLLTLEERHHGEEFQALLAPWGGAARNQELATLGVRTHGVSYATATSIFHQRRYAWLDAQL